MQLCWKILQFISEKLKMGGAVCLMGMTALTCVDVVGRFFKHPVFGSVELTTFMGVLVCAFALPYTHETKSHIGVEMVVDRLPRKARAVINCLTHLVSLGLFSLVTWRMFDYAVKMKASGEVSMNLQFPEYLIIFWVAFSFLIFTLTIIKGIGDSIREWR